MNRPRIILADDHQIVLDGLKRLLEAEFDLVSIVKDGRSLVKEADRLQPDVIVADISMPLLNGIEAVEQLKKIDIRAKIIFLTMHPDVTYATRAFEAGASGYVLKHSASSELITAIREVLKGRKYITPRIAGDLLQSYKEGAHKSNDTIHKLTSRQREVLQLLAEGNSAKEIATILNISHRTVEFHKYHIMEEVGVSNSAELTKFAIKHGIVEI
jgi:DNA-binding NarL/FixJ family response regulator